MKSLSITSKANAVLELLSKNIKKNKSFLHLHEPYLSGKETSYIKECIETNSISTIGEHSNIFLSKIKKITGIKYAVLTCNGTSALHTALISAGIKKNQEILMPSLNYIASAYATLYANAIPHFVEVLEETLSIDPDKLTEYLKKISIIKKNKLLNKKSGRTISALICMHTFGHPAKIDLIKKICKKNKLILIEDSAEALGSYYKKRHLGTFGNVGVLSFNGNKIISTGAGGAIMTNNKKIFRQARHLIQNSKINHSYLFNYNKLGFNYRLSNINCALGIAQIDNLKKILKNKRQLFKLYSKIFKKLKYIEIFKEPPNSKSNYWLQTILLKKPNLELRNKILHITNKNQISTRPLWTLLHKIKFLKKFQRMKLDVSTKLEKRIINIPSSPNIIK